MVCSEIVFSGYDFVFENITTLYLKSTEAGLMLKILVLKKVLDCGGCCGGKGQDALGRAFGREVARQAP